MPEPLTWEVRACVATQFPEPVRAQAIQALERYQGQEVNRVRLAALTLARDDLSELLLQVQEAQQDYRDVLLAAEDAARQPNGVNWQSPPADAPVSVTGWLTCPGCGRRFCLSNTRSWNGQRHRRCGQRTHPVMSPAPPAI